MPSRRWKGAEVASPSSRGKGLLAMLVVAVLGASLLGPTGVDASEGAPGSDMFVKGVLSFDGTNVYTIPAGDLAFLSGPDTQVETFFVSLSVYLTRGPSGGYRGILFKGTKNAHRTPSMWLLPDSNQVTFRIKDVRDDEVWYTSRREVALDRWTHLGLTVAPAAAEDEEDGGSGDGFGYVMSLFVDGELDSKIELVHAPMANLGPLHVGKDVSRGKGMAGLISQLEIGSEVVTRREMREKFVAASKALEELTGHALTSARMEEWHRGDIWGPLSGEEEGGAACPAPGSSAGAQPQPAYPEAARGKIYLSNWALLERSLSSAADEELGVPAASEEAQMNTYLQLAWKSFFGVDSNPRECGVASFYMRRAAELSAVLYQRPGGQHHPENVPLSDKIGSERQDQHGEDADDSWALDAMARGGDVNAALTLANRHFYGHHGFEKNMTSALEYFKMAHRHGSDVGSIAYAKMLLRGDATGGQPNGRMAYDLYDGITQRSVNPTHIAEAYNGMGYLFFYGHGMPQNKTMALEKFESAAAEGSSQGALNAALLMNEDQEAERGKAFK